MTTPPPLLPEGWTCISTYAVRWYYPDAKPLVWGCETLAEAQEMTPPRDAVRGEVLSREQWTSPYVVLERVEGEKRR
jgi:hypothetical protein